ncbi:MAG: UDP-3-O-(3-hydroxymyristoyl)glucosamine N-acyltransferase [Gammaproteobacteria bacterium]|nr:UDP-3-O-(3-hydroxymyristoyl)glucosamine N-acyltransferase [Gammaproteobacteria bacterium]
MTLILSELAQAIGAELHTDDGAVDIESVVSLKQATSKDISFLSNAYYKSLLAETQAAAIILSEEFLADCPVSALVVKDPYVAYARVVELINPRSKSSAGVHASTIMGESVDIAADVSIAANCVIGSNVRIGAGVEIGPSCVISDHVSIDDNSRLVANVTICSNVRIGVRAIIHPGVVIGADGFGLAWDKDHWLKVPQIGGVSIGDDVEIGANTTIDRGALDDTILGDDVKLDNQIQVAHNVVIGDHSAIAGCVGIAGSAHIGKHCRIGGGAGILGHLEIVDHVTVTAMSLVSRSITQAGEYSSSMPVQSKELWQRNNARLRRLDKMIRKGRLNN